MPMQDAGASRPKGKAHEAYRAWLLADAPADNDGRPGQPDHSVDRQAFFAFAELSALRLQADRALISLVEPEWQHVIAEAMANSATAPKKEPLFGIASLPLKDAFLDRAILQDGESCDHFASLDCAKDDRFREHALVKEDGRVRFSVGVPLVAQDNVKMGALVVMSDSPRDTVQQGDIDALHGYARCIVRYLELIRSTVDPSREVGVLRGLVRSMTNEYQPKQERETAQDVESPSMQQGIALMNTTTGRRPSTKPVRPNSMEAALIAAFSGAAAVLRQCSFAEGALIIGLQSLSALASTGNSFAFRGDDSDAEKAQSSLLASSLQDGVTCAAVQKRQTPSVGTLRRFASLYPDGYVFMAFDVTEKSLAERSGFNDIPRRPNPALALDPEKIDHQEEGSWEDASADILATLEDARSLIFLPVHDHDNDALLACCFLWDCSGIRMARNYQDIVEYRALGKLLSKNFGQIRMQTTDTEQDRFMSNFSHELRSPIHGVLGAAQFLQDTVSEDYQNSLLQSIVVSSNTLLDTLNVVLDYAKFQQIADELKNPRMQVGPEAASPAMTRPIFATASCDLALIIEDACETMVAGHFFDNLPGTTEVEEYGRQRNADSTWQTEDSGTTQDVKVVLQLAPRPSWTVKTSPGAVSRIMMNLVGNALKFTHKGIVKISLDAQEYGDDSHIKVRIKIEDTGTGMSANFRNNHLFAPFHQENQFAPGVGLGMSVVKQIVSALDGDIHVQSRLHEGTSVNLDLVFPLTQGSAEGVPEDLRQNLERIKGKHLVLLNIFEMYHGKKPSQSIIDREDALRSVAENWLQMKVSKTSDINQAEADFYLFSEPPPADDILSHHNHAADLHSSNLEIPLIIVTTDLKEAHTINRNHAVSLEKTGRIVQVLSQPCGPRKLAKVLNLSLDRSLQSQKDRAAHKDPDPDSGESSQKPSEAQPNVESDQYGNINDGEHLSRARGPPSVTSPPARQKSVSKSSSPGGRGYSKGEPAKEEGKNLVVSGDISPIMAKKDDYQFNKSSDPEPPFATPLIVDRRPSDVGPAERDAPPRKKLHGLLVDDNKINLRLLVTLMKKISYTYEQAENGQEAFDTFKLSSGTEKSFEEPIEKFDFICMDIGMPLMNGLDSTRAIRAHERKHNLSPTYIIACTAWGDEQTQREAEAAGVDAFLPKPLKFANLKELLAGLLAKKG